MSRHARSRWRPGSLRAAAILAALAAALIPIGLIPGLWLPAVLGTSCAAAALALAIPLPEPQEDLAR